MTFPLLPDPTGPGSKAWKASEALVEALAKGDPWRVRITKDYMTRVLRREGVEPGVIMQWVSACAELANEEAGQ